MVKLVVNYLGELHCKATHESSGSQIETDAPTDIGGRGSLFSPTDLLACSLATCIATTMGLYAKRKNWDLSGMQLITEKIMVDNPTRRIGRIEINIQIPQDFSIENQQILEKIAQTCPVHKSLHPDVEVVMNFQWKN